MKQKKTPPLKIEGQGSWIGEAYFLLYRKYRVAVKRESSDSYRVKSPAGQDAHLAEL